jgi:glycosyltransferase involved in cell wall biosynthesis
LTKHILVVPSWYSSGRGSGGGYFRDQALALQSAGHRVAIVAPDIHTWRDVRDGRVRRRGRGRDGNVSVENDGVPVYRRDDFTALPRLPYRNPLAWTVCGMKLAQRYIDENGRPDLVHAHCCLNAGVLALALHRRYGIPFVVTEHSAGPARPRWWERDLIGRVIKRARRCIAVSPYLAALLQNEYAGSSWEYLPNVLGEAFLSAAGYLETPGRDRAFVFLCVARLSPEKGHALLIGAFAQAFGGNPNVHLRLVGDGPALPSLEQLNAELGIAAQVEFVGALPAERVRAEMEAADAFVLASNAETFGVVMIEALACGLPVVSTASGGPDHLVDATNGELVPRGEKPALCDAMLRMRRHAAHYDRAAIRAEVIGRYGPDAFARQFAAIIA